MNALGVDCACDGQLVAFVEIGEKDSATCFVDDIQMITGWTFGKGNIHRLQHGKWGVTLIDKATSRAVRVTPAADAMRDLKSIAECVTAAIRLYSQRASKRSAKRKRISTYADPCRSLRFLAECF